MGWISRASRMASGYAAVHLAVALHDGYGPVDGRHHFAAARLHHFVHEAVGVGLDFHGIEVLKVRLDELPERVEFPRAVQEEGAHLSEDRGEVVFQKREVGAVPAQHGDKGRVIFFNENRLCHLVHPRRSSRHDQAPAVKRCSPGPPPFSDAITSKAFSNSVDLSKK